MNITKKKIMFLFNLIGIVINFFISLIYVLSVKEFTAGFIFIVNIFFLFSANLICAITNTQENKSCMKLMFVACLIVVIYGIAKSIIENTIANTYHGHIVCIYLLVNIIYRLFFEKKIEK